MFYPILGKMLLVSSEDGVEICRDFLDLLDHVGFPMFPTVSHLLFVHQLQTVDGLWPVCLK